MNRSAILILMLVALVLAGILIFLKNDQSTPRPRSPFEDINTVTANRIRCERRDQSAWTLEFREGRWMIDEHGTTPPARADAASVQKILGFLRDIRPTEWLDMDEQVLKEAGLNQPRIRLSVRDDVHESVLEFGDTDIHDLVAVRRPGERRVFKVDSPLVDTLSQDARLLRETRLVAFEANSIARIRIDHDTQTKIEIERVGQRWYGRHENGLWRADRQMCDTLELTVTQIRVVGAPDAAFRPKDPPEWRIHVVDLLGQTIEVLAESWAGQNKIMARRVDEEFYAPVDAGPFRAFMRPQEDYRDRVVTGLTLPEIAEIRLGRSATQPDLHLVKRSTSFGVQRPDGTLKMADQDRLRVFLDRLLNLPGRPVQLESEPTMTQELTIVLASTAGLPDLRVGFSDPDGERRVFARRSDEAGFYIVDGEAANVLQTPYWGLLLKTPVLGNDAQIDWIRLTSSEGVSREILRSPDGSFHFSNADVPREFLQGLLSKLACLSVWEYVGPPDAAARAGLEQPKWRVEWRHSIGALPRDIDPLKPVKYDMYEWRVGRSQDGSKYESSLSTLPDLIFLLPGEDLSVFSDVWRGLDAAALRAGPPR